MEMESGISRDKLLNYFGVKSHKELELYLQNNPEEPKVKELKELMDYLYHLTGDENNG